MRYRPFGGTGWDVSEVGYGMWGMAGWTGSADEESLASLDRAVALGCNFFDTAWAYGDGHSEQLLGRTLTRHVGTRLYIATKIPPKNRKWPALADYALDDVYPPDYIREYTELSLRNLGVSTLDLQQFHVWSDTWADDSRWQRAASKLKEEGLVRAIGISINRWQPANVLRALDTGLVDAVQVVYNVFDQSPEDELFRACRDKPSAVFPGGGCSTDARAYRTCASCAHLPTGGGSAAPSRRARREARNAARRSPDWLRPGAA